MFEDDGEARTKLLSHLGFSPPAEEEGTVENHISDQMNALHLNESEKDKDGYDTTKETAMYANDNGEDFFNNLPSPKADTPVATSESKFITGDSVPVEEGSQLEMDGQQENDDSSFDDAVQRALVVGDYKWAVALCISANRMADALIIAHAGGSLLWESTRDKYFQSSFSPYLKVIICRFLFGLANVLFLLVSSVVIVSIVSLHKDVVHCGLLTCFRLLLQW